MTNNGFRKVYGREMARAIEKLHRTISTMFELDLGWRVTYDDVDRMLRGFQNEQN